MEEHFTPTYDPWDQRFCAVPDADLFRTIRHGDADVVTDHDRVASCPRASGCAADGCSRPTSWSRPPGCKLLPFGGIAPSVDGETVDLHEQFVWQGAMITGLPNFAVCIGYTNASWTLRADLTHRLVCRVLNHLTRHDQVAAVPRPREELEERPLLDLSSGYIQRSIADFPRQGDRGPWRVRQNYLIDSVTTMRHDLTTSMDFTPRAPATGGRVTRRAAAALRAHAPDALPAGRCPGHGPHRHCPAGHPRRASEGQARGAAVTR